jgi:hypothetical protein
MSVFPSLTPARLIQDERPVRTSWKTIQPGIVIIAGAYRIAKGRSCKYAEIIAEFADSAATGIDLNKTTQAAKDGVHCQ